MISQMVRSAARTAAAAAVARGGGPFQHDDSIDRAVKILPPIRRCELHTLQGDLGRELEGTGHRGLQLGLDEV
jgi:hypothetical protein